MKSAIALVIGLVLTVAWVFVWLVLLGGNANAADDTRKQIKRELVAQELRAMERARIRGEVNAERAAAQAARRAAVQQYHSVEAQNQRFHCATHHNRLPGCL